eukprot:TRINITY_DN12201_c0_g1_i2.p1 TRINITY_DN12201_c0_g1~~TRINITY_DN12201_c0_g1_i2.p1  ORF type:complete len:1078 (+),score=300.42 TRINITY_DN12201_c0_g1_i2:70-3234(+)
MASAAVAEAASSITEPTFLYRDAVNKRINEYTAQRQIAELQVLLSRCAAVDVKLTLQLKSQMQEHNIPIPDYLHLTVLSHMVAAAGPEQRAVVAAQYLSQLSIADQARLCHMPLDLFTGVEREAILSSSAKFVFERRPVPAITPTIQPVTPATAPVSSSNSRLFDLAGPQGWALTDSLAPHVNLNQAELQQLPPVLAALLLDPSSGFLNSDTVVRREAVGPVLQALSFCTAQEAAIYIPQLLRMAVHDNILLPGISASSILAMPHLIDADAFSADWLADLCYGLHLTDCHFTPNDVDAVLAAAATVNGTEADSMILRPLVGLMLPPGADLIEFMERLQLARLSSGQDQSASYINRVVCLLLDCAANRHDHGALQHLLSSLQRLPEAHRQCRFDIQDKVVKASLPSRSYMFTFLTNQAFVPMSASAVSLLLQSALDTGRYSKAYEMFAQLMATPADGFASSTWSDWASKLLIVSTKRKTKSAVATLQLFQELQAKGMDAFAEAVVNSALQSNDASHTLQVLSRVLSAACDNPKQVQTGLFNRARDGIVKMLTEQILYDVKDLDLVVNNLTQLCVILVNDRQHHAAWQQELARLSSLATKVPDPDLAGQAKDKLFAQTLVYFADKGDAAALEAVISQLPDVSVTYREVAVAALDALQAEAKPNQFQVAYELQEAFINQKIRFPASVHVRYLEHIANSNDISMVVNTFMRMKDNGIQPPRDTYATLSKVFGRTGNFKAAVKVLEQMHASQQRPTLSIYHSIIQAVSKPSDMKQLNRLLELLEDDQIKLNVVSYTLLARKHLRFKQPDKAATLLHNILARGEMLSVEAAQAWLQALSELDTDVIDQMKHLYQHIKEHQLDVGLKFYFLFLKSVVNSLQALKREDQNPQASKQAKDMVDLGWQVYDDMIDAEMRPSIDVLNMALALTAQQSDLERAQEILQVIRTQQLQPQPTTFKHLADACGQANNLPAMQQAFDEYLEAFAPPQDLEVFKVLIYHYGRQRDIDAAMRVYDRMEQYDLVPDEELNNILVDVCGIDKTSVLLNAARAEEKRMRQQHQSS